MPGRGESLPKPSSKFPEKNNNKNTPDHLYITKKIIIEKIAEYFTVVIILKLRLSGIISKIPHRNSKILFVLVSYEYLERLEGKIRE